jgi:HK97 family phage major capsid protein
VQGIVFNDLSAVVAKFTDESFLDPGLDAVAGVSPASVTFGATNVPSTGITAAQIEADLGNLLAAITTDRTAVFLIMRRSTALAISRLRNATSGAVTFPGMTFNGGEIWGVPVIVSDNLPDDANSPQENIIVAIDASEILIADAGVELDVSENAILQMDSSPTHPIVAGTSVVSLWQHNLIAVRVLRFINWARRRSGAVAYISGVQV